MANVQKNKFSLTNALQSKISPPSGVSNMTSTPQYSVQQPNTPLNIVYGGKPYVPSGQYSSTSTMPQIKPGTAPLNPVGQQNGLANSALSQNKPNPLGALQTGLNNFKTQQSQVAGSPYNTQNTPPVNTPPPVETPKEKTFQDKYAQGNLYSQAVGQVSAYGEDKNAPEIAVAQNALTEAQAEYTKLANEYEDAKKSAGQQGNVAIQQGQEGLMGRAYEAKLANAQQRISAAQTALSTAAGIQGQRIEAAASAAGMTAPQAYSLYSQPYNPTTDTYGGGGVSGATDRAALAGKIGATETLGKSYEEGKARLNGAQAIEVDISNLLNTHADLNAIPLTIGTNINQFLSGQWGGNPQQQELSGMVNNYIAQLGLDTGTAANIASQQKGTMRDLLMSLKKQAIALNEAKKVGTGGGGTSSNPLNLPGY